MAVITPDGVVGKLRDVFPHTAQVLELDDPSSGAGVILESTRILGILRGTLAGGIQINNLTADSRIQPGERVLTSGGDQVYPHGLNVGTIESIKPDPEHQPYTAIAIRPAAHLDQLEEVLVITGTQSTLPAQMQKDLSGAEATAEATRAASAAAESLPGIEDPAHPTAAAANASPTPRPLPALHADRFTPGATPPAAQLRPGGDGATSTSGSSPEKAP
jgi:rod shape-determining protein MreC